MSLMGMIIIQQNFSVSSKKAGLVKKFGSAASTMFVNLKVQYCFKERKMIE
jgi:hypothetical protein